MGEVASVAGLAARLYLGGAGTPRRYFAWGQAVRRAVPAVLLVDAALGLAAVTAVIRQAYDSGGAVGISVAGKLWQAPIVRQLFPGQRLLITLLSRNQARQLHRMLVPTG